MYDTPGRTFVTIGTYSILWPIVVVLLGGDITPILTFGTGVVLLAIGLTLDFWIGEERLDYLWLELNKSLDNYNHHAPTSCKLWRLWRSTISNKKERC